MNILIPMLGKGERFKDFYTEPKPLIKFLNKTLIQHSIDTIGIQGKFIFVVRKYDNEIYNQELKRILLEFSPECEIISVQGDTQGAAETCLLAEKKIDPDDSLVITNCDQFLNWNPELFLNFVVENNLDACVTTYPHSNIKLNEKSPYSFAKLNNKGYVCEFREKFAISKNSLNGIHYWKKASFFLESAKKLIKSEVKTNNEYYISETFNHIIEKGYKVKIFKMKKNQFYSLGVPQDLINNENKIKKIMNEDSTITRGEQFEKSAKFII